MPSKIRPIMQWSGQWYTGGNVNRTLKYYLDKYAILWPKRVEGEPKWKHLKKMYELWAKANPSEPMGFWLFREGRRTNRQSSRYKLLCGYLGCSKIIPRKIKKLKLRPQYQVVVDPLFQPRRPARGNANGRPRVPGTRTATGVAAILERQAELVARDARRVAQNNPPPVEPVRMPGWEGWEIPDNG